MRSSASHRKRIFSYAEAATLLPEVRRLTQGVVEHLEELGVRFGEEGQLVDDRPEVHGVVTGWAETVQELGLEVKGLWLVDFDNGSGYYCWRYPEESLMFYHSYEEGFGGRMRIQ